jgi:hypothetical protein
MKPRCAGILMIFAIWALGVPGITSGAGQDKNVISESLLDAEEKLAELKSNLADKEKILNLLKGSSCKDGDDKCRQQKAFLGKKLRRKLVRSLMTFCIQ